MQHPQNDPSRVQHVHLSDVCARSKPVTESAWSEVAATYDVEKRECVKLIAYLHAILPRTYPTAKGTPAKKKR